MRTVRLLVPIGRLTANAAPMDVHEAALLAAVAASPPSGGGETGGSPTSAAVRGMLDAALAHAAANPAERTIAVLVTDGPVNGCIEDFSQISAMAASALTSSVRTYVIGLGVADQNLNTLAAAGGTTRSYTVSHSANMSRDLSLALGAVRSDRLGCDFTLTVAPSGAPVDFERVSVVVTSMSGSRTVIPRVGSAADCGAASAWHYDTPTAPRRILLCPAACELLAGAAALEINTVCATRP
jgi:hypothetical protein